MFKLDLEKAEEPEIKLPTSVGSLKKRVPEKHDAMITYIEPDILECKVKWSLGGITTNKASGGDGIPVEMFQS